MQFKNRFNISLPLAVWLATDDYDKQNNAISATAIIKPIKQTILSQRAFKEGLVLAPDVVEMVKSRIGTAIHDSIEKAWLNDNLPQVLESLGFQKEVAHKVVVNPEKVEPGQIPVYLEQRVTRKVAGKNVTGKYDMVTDGTVRDFKSTSVFVVRNSKKTEDYQLQGSIYRFLNPDVIYNGEYMYVDHILTDFKPNPNDPLSPDHAVPSIKIPLMSLDETEKYITEKLEALEKYKDAPEEQLPTCTPKDLWQDDPKYKYYADPNKKTRATKVFDNFMDAQDHADKKGKGVVDKVYGKARACLYCSGFTLCKQKDRLIAEGKLEI